MSPTCTVFGSQRTTLLGQPPGIAFIDQASASTRGWLSFGAGPRRLTNAKANYSFNRFNQYSRWRSSPKGIPVADLWGEHWLEHPCEGAQPFQTPASSPSKHRA